MAESADTRMTSVEETTASSLAAWDDFRASVSSPEMCDPSEGSLVAAALVADVRDIRARFGELFVIAKPGSTARRLANGLHAAERAGLAAQRMGVRALTERLRRDETATRVACAELYASLDSAVTSLAGAIRLIPDMDADSATDLAPILDLTAEEIIVEVPDDETEPESSTRPVAESRPPRAALGLIVGAAEPDAFLDRSDRLGAAARGEDRAVLPDDVGDGATEERGDDLATESLDVEDAAAPSPVIESPDILATPVWSPPVRAADPSAAVGVGAGRLTRRRAERRRVRDARRQALQEKRRRRLEELKRERALIAADQIARREDIRVRPRTPTWLRQLLMIVLVGVLVAMIVIGVWFMLTARGVF